MKLLRSGADLYSALLQTAFLHHRIYCICNNKSILFSIFRGLKQVAVLLQHTHSKKKKSHREGNKRKASQRHDDTKSSETDRKREPLALSTGGGFFACGAWKEPQETSSHPPLVDNLRVT